MRVKETKLSKKEVVSNELSSFSNDIAQFMVDYKNIIFVKTLGVVMLLGAIIAIPLLIKGGYDSDYMTIAAFSLLVGTAALIVPIKYIS